MASEQLLVKNKRKTSLRKLIILDQDHTIFPELVGTFQNT